jgi:oligosaccharide repeat unit polymerase
MNHPMLLGALTLAVGLCARVTERSWIAPATLFAVLWGGYVIAASMFFVDPEVMVDGVLWVFLATLAVYAGSIFGRTTLPAIRPAAAPEPSLEAVTPVFPHLRLIAALSVVVGLGEIYYLFARHGYSWREVLTLTAIAQLTADNRSDYGYGELQQGVVERLVFMLMYLAPLFGGLLFRTARGGTDRLLALLTLVLPVLITAFYGSRMGILYAGSFWLASYLAASALRSGHQRSRSAGLLVRIAAVGAALMLGLSGVAQALRYTTHVQYLDWFRIFADPFGFLAAFGTWYDAHGFQLDGFYYGARTFRRVVELIGISQPLAPAIQVGFTSSNIYTVFRDLIEDFGDIGALLFLFAYGYLGYIAFSRVVAGRLRYVPLAALVFAFALTSFAISIFLYTVTSVAVLIFAMYFAVTRVRWIAELPPEGEHPK